MSKKSIPSIAALAFGLTGCAGSRLCVSPGDTGSIDFPVRAGEMGLPLEGVTVKISADPNLDFKVRQSSQIGPVNISSGTTKVFLIDYEIGPNAKAGKRNVQLSESIPNPDAYSDPDNPKDAGLARFVVKKRCPNEKAR
jgi:hypothetical protein